MWTWCINDFNTLWTSEQWKAQRYWQYSLQFIDYNSDANWDNWKLWDTDGDWKLTWDSDDEFLGRWPEAFELNKNLTELYLISWGKKHRTYFRYSVKQDPNISAYTCNSSDWNKHSPNCIVQN